jgi:putative hydrolase of the HAD superfamily
VERRFELAPSDIERLAWGDVGQAGRIGSNAFWDDLGRRGGLDGEELVELRRALQAGYRLDEQLLSFIRRLHQEGFRTALLSNGPADLRQYLKDLGIVGAFDVVVISGEVGVAKSVPAIYELALEQLGATAEETMFVHNSETDVRTADRFGIHLMCFFGFEFLLKELSDLGVPVPNRAVDPLPDVRAVIFDWGGVMEPLPREAQVAEWERRLALAPGTLPVVLWGELWRQWEVGTISDDGYLRQIADRLGLPDANRARDFLQEFYTTDRLNAEVVGAARSLRGRYKVALLTNAFPRQDVILREHYGIDVHAEFDAYVNSAHVGMSKPDPAIYQLVLHQLDVKPEQAIFLDDNLLNVDAARAAGIQAIQFVDPDTSLSALDALLGHTIGMDWQD